MTQLPPGRYERLIDQQLREQLRDLKVSVEVGKVDAAEAPGALVRFLAPHIERAFSAVGEKRVEDQWKLCNQILRLLGEGPSFENSDLLDLAQEELLAVARPQEGLADAAAGVPTRPSLPLSLSELLVNGRGEHQVGAVLKEELPSVDHVDMLCSFLKWSGFLLIRDALAELRARGGRLRVLTTAYCGATEERVLDALQEMGAEVRVSLDTRRTRLHAKAWLLRRDSGFSTALIGSSNLSAAAMQQGLEWNVRLSAVENAAILERFRATIDSYWEDHEFQPWADASVRKQFRQAIQSEGRGAADTDSELLGFRFTPYSFQEEILERLAAARSVHDRHRNLVVAATGTGKTVVAAFDYARLCAAKQLQTPGAARPSLLFVAHRKEILTQSRRTFREVLQDGSFGELLADGQRPEDGTHVFASVQSLSHQKIETLNPAAYDIVIVDEFHHAQASTYQRFLNHLQPQELLGLTATPERADGHFVQDTFFGGKITAELRLWDALDRGLLAPFQYFGIADGTDLTGVTWRRSGYHITELSAVYTGDDIRARLVERQVRDKVADPNRMRALGFCVSVKHAEFMTAKFKEWGYRAVCVTGNTPMDERRQAIQKLQSGGLQVIFSVDIFNEGVDIPSVDTLLLLRPTASATLFQQQLGRGLRFYEGKECLTALDFIGQANRKYSWANVLRGVTGGSARQVETMVAEGFATLPPGCAMQLDKQSKQYVLENIRQATHNAWIGFAQELRELPASTSLSDFLSHAQIDVEDVYDRSGRTWSLLRAQAGHVATPGASSTSSPTPPNAEAWKAVARLRGVDDPDLLRVWKDMLVNPDLAVQPKVRRHAGILAATLLKSLDKDAPKELRDLLLRDEALCEELRELFTALIQRVTHAPIALTALPNMPLQIHCRYSLKEILAGFNIRHEVREGVKHDSETGATLLFVTLNKSEKEYSPRTMYRDYAISPELFHWESQNSTRPETKTGQRYLLKRSSENPVLLFVRNSKTGKGGVTEPYFFAGPMKYVSHQGSRPMQITWRLEHPLAGDWFRLAKVAAG